MPVDTSYARDENVQTAKGFGVELVGPVPGSNSQAAADDLTIDDFNVGDTSGTEDYFSRGTDSRLEKRVFQAV